MVDRERVVVERRQGRTARMPLGLVGTAGLVLLGSCQAGGTGLIGPMRPKDIDTYTRIEVKNPLSIVRQSEVVEIPLQVVKSDYRSFFERDFSVHLLDTTLYAEGDPLLATNPPPEVPAQLSDRDLDGEMDTILVSLDFEPSERKFLAVCSPRFSPRMPKPETGVHAGLWQRETVTRRADTLAGDGAFVQLETETLSPLHRPGDQLYFLDAVLFETERIAYRLMFDRRLSVDVIGKQTPGLWLDDVLAGMGTNVGMDLPEGTGRSLLGEPALFGAGSLAMADGKQLEALGAFNSVQYRLAANGPVAGEVEILIAGCQLGDRAVDVTWRISCYRGNGHLEHRIRVSDPGHHLAFAAAEPSGLRREVPSARSGWMKALSYGSSQLGTGAGGRLGVALITKGSQCIGFGSETIPVDRLGGGIELGRSGAMGMRFDPMLKSFHAFVLASWSEEPFGCRSIDELESRTDDLILRINNPILCKSRDYRGS